MNYRIARELFLQAHNIRPGGQSLRGLGISSFNLQEVIPSVRYLRASLIEKREPLNRDQRIEVNLYRLRARRLLGNFIVKVFPKSASVTLDGMPLSREPDDSVLIGLGWHRLEAYYVNYETVKRTFEVKGGEDMEIHLILQKKKRSRK